MNQSLGRQFQGQAYHVAPTDVRDQISSKGLDARHGEKFFDTMDYPTGNYLFGSRQDAFAEASRRSQHEREEYGSMDARNFDVWEADVDHTIHDDPLAYGHEGSGPVFYTPDPIPKVRRLSDSD